MCSGTNRLKEKDEGIFSIKELFEKEIELKVPLYQRRYAWGKKELDQLFYDIYWQMDGDIEEYFIGTLVLFKKGSLYDIVDGQQRVTTLLLILLTLKENSIERKLRLRYAARESIEKIFESNLEKLDLEECKEIAINKNIIENLLNSLDEEKRQKFNEYFLKKVKLVVTILPSNTDVNKYFEIMNTRGKQLELHEILKARFLSGIEEDNKNRFSILWDICADMDTHVSKKIKSCDNINIKEYSQVLDFNASGKENTNKKSLRKILGSIDENLNNTKENQKAEVDENEGKYKSIINFPNFLCIVRKILEETSKDSISLDDKNLLKNFEDELKLDGNKFILDLLNYRLLFDSFIIRREEKKDWVLKKYIIQEGNKSYGYKNTFSKIEDNGDNEDNISKKIRQLQAMLQVSFSTQTYKNWLYEALNFLGEKSVDVESVKDLSQNLVSDNEKTFYMKLKEIAKEAILSNDILKDKNNLNKGVRTTHAIFHLLDYIIWEKSVGIKIEEYSKILGVEKEFENKLKKFKFMYCNSIEHVYPQSEKIIDDFGNLCLITKEFNSSLSDSSYKSKKVKFEEYLSHQESCASLKQAIIFSMCNKKDEWTEEDIKTHGEEMFKLLEEF